MKKYNNKKCYTEELYRKVMTLKGDAKFKGKLTCGLKNDIRNLVGFHVSSQKSEHFHINGHLLSKVYKISE